MEESFRRLEDVLPEKPKALWGIKEMALCMVVVVVALFVITTAIIGPFLAAYGEDAPETLTASSIANLLWNAVMVASVLWFVRRAGGGLREVGLARPAGEGNPWPGVAGQAVATFVLMYVLIILYGVAISLFGLGFLEPDQQVSDEFYDSNVALAVLGVAIVLGAPLAEEVFFRGFLFGGTRPITGVLPAALITGFIFSMAHYNLGLVIPFTLIGALLAMSYQRSGTLFVPIGAHLLFNLVSFSILLFFPEARPD